MQKQILLIFILSFAYVYINKAQQTPSKDTTPSKEKTAFQTASPWMPEIDVRSDIAIVYGAGDQPEMTFEQSKIVAGQRIPDGFYDRYRLGIV